MAEATDNPSEKPKKAGGGPVGLIINGIGIFALSLGAVVAGGFINAKLHPPQELAIGADGKLTVRAGEAHEEKKSDEHKAAFYFSFDPPLVVNFDDAQSVRFLQLQVDVLTREEHDVDLIKLHAPAIRNNLLLLMTGRDYKTLMSREGKEALRQECLKEVQAILKKETGKPVVENLFFTSFVVQ